ncbi:MAG TPA: hypothetical protein PKI54_13415, partial [Bacteroidia bacterium]|nr:hypothetical protein [Bacteroidia bacterium]
LIIGNIGNGINRQFGGFIHTKNDKGSRKQPYDEFIPYGKLDDFIKHILELIIKLNFETCPKFRRNNRKAY